MSKKFLRRDTYKYLKLGRKRKKKRKWRKARGRDNKIREKRKGYLKKVEIGYKRRREDRKKQIVARNLKELERFRGKEIIFGKIGEKKRLEMLKKAQELKIRILNPRKEK